MLFSCSVFTELLPQNPFRTVSSKFMNDATGQLPKYRRKPLTSLLFAVSVQVGQAVIY
jgi:hypothetical protein